MSFTIVGMGTAVPPNAINAEEAVRIARTVCCRTDAQAAWVDLIYSQSGIATRHLSFPRELVNDVLHGTHTSHSVFLPKQSGDGLGPTTGQRMSHYTEQAGPLAVSAARRALEASGRPANTLTHLITVSCTGFRAPGLELALIKGLNLAPTIQRTQIGFMGCHAALNGMRVANAFTSADPSAAILLCATELCSLHYYYGWDPEKLVANALFADGAAAVVGVAGSAAAPDCWQVAATGSCVFADSEADMGWVVGDHGFEMTLSKRVPGLIARHLRPWLERWLHSHNVSLADVGSWAVHPGGPLILSAVEEALDLPNTATAVSREVLGKYGNMSSPTILFVLDRLRARRSPRPCVALGFGPGLAAEAVLFE
jgi:predicted naringenin-chalcone synthase